MPRLAFIPAGLLGGSGQIAICPYISAPSRLRAFLLDSSTPRLLDSFVTIRLSFRSHGQEALLRWSGRYGGGARGERVLAYV